MYIRMTTHMCRPGFGDITSRIGFMRDADALHLESLTAASTGSRNGPAVEGPLSLFDKATYEGGGGTYTISLANRDATYDVDQPAARRVDFPLELELVS